MTTQTFSRRQTRGFSDFSAQFSEDQSLYATFLSRPFSQLSDLTEQIRLKSQSYSAGKRKLLVEVLHRQLGNTLSDLQRKNLDLLSGEKTFTIATGHQLTLFGGPLFLIYKVLHAVKLSQLFNDSQDEFKTVPLFWLASEDHDVDEIRSASLFNRQFTWETTQTGAVGRFELSDFEAVKNEVRELFAGREDNEFIRLLDGIAASTYGDWYQQFATKLFAHYGVLVLQPDDNALKSLFAPVMKEEISAGESYGKVLEANERLESRGLKPQANGRACNLFYLAEGRRTKIEPVDGQFSIGDQRFSQEELLQKLEREPENFSPNVILRPVYQETILPNACYIGGGGEMAYWIQLKSVFELYAVPFPLLLQRISFSLVDGGTRKKIEKFGFERDFFFRPVEEIKQTYLVQNTEDELDTTEIDSRFDELKTALIQKSRQVDAGQLSAAEAECARIEKQVDAFKQRLKKQVRQQHDQALKNLESVSQRLYPNNELQERALHWLNFAADGNFDALFEKVYEAIDPFEGRLVYLEV